MNRLLLLLIVFASTAIGQTGPGGVGKTDGTSSLKLWLDAADATTKTLNSSSVTQWNDKSGNGSNASQGTASQQPTNNATGINSRATIAFDGSDDELYLPASSVASTDAAFSMFYVGKKNSLTAYDCALTLESGDTYGFFGTFTSTITFYSGNFNTFPRNGTTALSTGNTILYEAHKTSSTFNMYLNGGIENSGTETGGSTFANGPSVGGPSGITSENWDGDIGEIIFYNTPINSAQRVIVGSYLAAKWGVSYATSKYSGSSSYATDVIGIGKESDGSNTLASSAGLVITDNSSLDANGEYLLAGHASGTNSEVTSDVPSGVTHRWSRIWYLDKTGTLGGADVKIGFDFSDGGLGGSPANAANYRLLTRSGTTGNFAVVTTSSSAIVGDNINFTVTDTNIPDGYYTVGTTDNTASPLPVELSSLEAFVRGSSVELNWKTATEVNNYGFEIERIPLGFADSHFTKGDKGGFQKVGFIEGAGTSNSPRDYSFVDHNLRSGTYGYRLKQIDRDGKFEFSQKVEVTIAGAPKVFALMQNYPNPFNPSTTIEFTLPEDGRVTLRVYDVLGKVVATLVDGELKAGTLHRATFDASRISSGIYFFRLEHKDKQLMKKLLVMK